MTGFVVAAPVLTGLALAAAAYYLTILSGGPDDAGVPESERLRRQALRAESAAYRWFEPTVRALADRLAVWVPGPVARLAHALDVLGTRHWRADEYLATRQVATLPVAVLVAGGGFVVAGPPGAVLGAVVVVLAGPYLALSATRAKARAHVQRVRGRLPFALDLMALMLEAGAGTLQQCLDRAAAEDRDHPLGREFRRVLVGLDQGQRAADVLAELDRRLDDPDVGELVLALNTAEERGIPLRDALRGQAARIGQWRIQWLEKSAEQAKVHITWPAMVVMLACLLIVVTPIVLAAVVGQ